jgi:hypothetical protein
MVLSTNAHKKNYQPNRSLRKNHQSEKFNIYISPLTEGSGFKIARKNDLTEYVYWDDPNELVDRLKLLDAEKAAGNNNLDNEIQNILEELQERRYIFH